MLPVRSSLRYGGIRAAFADLYTLGLTNTSPDIFSTMTSGQGLHLLGDRVTSLGKVFVAFCQAPQPNSVNEGGL